MTLTLSQRRAVSKEVAKRHQEVRKKEKTRIDSKEHRRFDKAQTGVCLSCLMRLRPQNKSSVSGIES